MSGNLLHAGVTMTCPHGGRASTATGPSDVLLDGMPMLTLASIHPVSGCPHTVSGRPQPCTSIRWRTGTRSVLIDGMPALLENSAGECFTDELVPQGAPHVAAVQQGVVCR